MKTLVALGLVAVLGACGGQPIKLPDGVTCGKEAMDYLSGKTVPAKADPDSDQFNEGYAAGWYLAAGCDVSGLNPFQ